jgi:hypothetical protein
MLVSPSSRIRATIKGVSTRISSPFSLTISSTLLGLLRPASCVHALRHEEVSGPFDHTVFFGD